MRAEIPEDIETEVWGTSLFVMASVRGPLGPLGPEYVQEIRADSQVLNEANLEKEREGVADGAAEDEVGVEEADGTTGPRNAAM
jgi:hypothetical protein